MDAIEDIEGLKPMWTNHMSAFLPPKSAYKRLHIIHLVHDVLVTIKNFKNYETILGYKQQMDVPKNLSLLKTLLRRLVCLAACRGELVEDEVKYKLLELVRLWKRMEIFEEDSIANMTAMVNATLTRDWEQALAEVNEEDGTAAAEAERKAKEEENWILPQRHGVKDIPNPPWHQLPAGNGLYMKSTRGYPLRAGGFSEGGYELKHGGQKADESLRKDVTSLHKEMKHAFDRHTNLDEVDDIDELGNKVWKDKDRPTRSSAGFTYDGPKKAETNRQRFEADATGYDDVEPLREEREVNTDIARARELAGGRGGFDRRGGRGRGGSGGWGRGQPRGGSGFRGRGGGPRGRFH